MASRLLRDLVPGVWGMGHHGVLRHNDLWGVLDVSVGWFRDSQQFDEGVHEVIVEHWRRDEWLELMGHGNTSGRRDSFTSSRRGRGVKRCGPNLISKKTKMMTLSPDLAFD